MKKLFALLIALMMVISLAACGENTDKPSGDTDKPGVSQSGNNGGEEKPKADVFDIADTDIRAYASDLTTTLTGDEAAAQIAKIPAEIKKGIGTLGKNLCTIAPDYSNDGTYNFGATFLVPKGSAAEYFTKLTDYYKTLDGTVKDESAVGDHHFFEMEFSWGALTKCENTAYNEEYEAINVSFDIKG